MRRWLVIPIVIVVAAGVAWLWWATPPSIVRSLPAGQTLVYVNWKPVRELMGSSGAAPRSAAYAAFVRESGFDFQRDLDAVALSLDGRPMEPRDATAILRGAFGAKFTAYLQQHALRQERIGGSAAYIFHGWARPQQLLTIVFLGPHALLVTNEADAAAVVGHAKRWWSTAPGLWQAGNNWRLLLGYGAMNAEQLEATRALDGTQPPWQGVERVEVRVRGGGEGVSVDGRAETTSSTAAAALQHWLQTELDALRPELREQPGQLTLRALLDRVQMGQQGNDVWLRMQVSGDTLRQWASARP